MSDGTPIDVPAMLRSQRDDRGRFVHPWPLEEGASRGLRDLLRWQRDRVRNGVVPDPPPHAFTVATPDVAQPRVARDELRITWIGHATFLIQLAGINVLTDPVWSARASPLPWAGPRRLVPAALPFAELPPIDAIVLSHDHYDHLDAPTVRRLQRRFGAQLHWITPLGYRRWLRRRSVRTVTELDWWGDASIDTAAGKLHVRAVPAQHWSKRTPFNERTRLWASFVLSAGGRRVYFCGDSGWFTGFGSIARLGAFDATLLPIGAYEPRWFMKPAHMNPEEAVRAYIALGATGLFVGMHWGTFRLTDEPAFEPPERTAAVWREHGLPAERLWLPRHGETRTIRHA
ncbi:MAG TPA: MBL fold metallo-hydrolase [Longimicrobiales bacterium]